MQSSTQARLAIEGGTPAVQHPLPRMFPGGMRLDRAEDAAVLDVLHRKRLFRDYGPEPGPSRVDDLEAAFRQVIGVGHCAAVNSGMSAVMSALTAIGIGPGDEVIVPAYTWIASAAAVTALGGVPIIAEVDDTLTLDPGDVEQRLTPRTRAIMPVHMRGAPCQMDALMDLATRHGLAVVEDCAQAMGGAWHGRRLGSIGNLGAFSLQFNKIITAGEGGLVTTNDETAYQRVKMFTDVASALHLGLPDTEWRVGLNLRLAELLGAVALAQLDRLDALIGDMRRHKARISDAIREPARKRKVAFRRLADPAGDTAIAIILLFPTVDAAVFATAALRAEGAGASLLYRPDEPDFHVAAHWTPILRQQTWSARGGPWQWHGGDVRYDPADWARSHDLLGRAVHLNVSPDLTDEQCDEVALAVTKVLDALP